MKLLTICFAVLLAGCADYNRVVDSAMEKACSLDGQTARDAFRIARTPEYIAKDRAICLRCPGETALHCTGDPMALPTDT